jgi:hypothetical protein
LCGRELEGLQLICISYIVILEPDVAAVFPDASAVNDALRALAGIIRS